jgi:phage shock protein C
MQNVQPSLFTREDTFFGVCQGLGEDLGIHSNILRLAFALALFFNPIATLAAYVGAGMLVAGSRWLFPQPLVEVEVAAEAEPLQAGAEAEPLPLAA